MWQPTEFFADWIHQLACQENSYVNDFRNSFNVAIPSSQKHPPTGCMPQAVYSCQFSSHRIIPDYIIFTTAKTAPVQSQNSSH
jgi:hypothetical protein